MDEWLAIADASNRNTPFLWVGPTAAGHLKPPGKILSEGNNALWHFTVEMGKEAGKRGCDALGMYNMTLQAQSWDGSGYGTRVALVQAMMVSQLPTHKDTGRSATVLTRKVIDYQLVVKIRVYIGAMK